MGPKPRAAPDCQVCNSNPSKYRCTTCPVRYCSVSCYKTHKESCKGVQSAAGPGSPRPSLEPNTAATDDPPVDHTSPQDSTRQGETDTGLNGKDKPLRPLTSLSWPPEPDPSIFTDPLRKEDPKPLRHEELLRIATSPDLRHLLAASSLPKILRILDALPTPQARQTCLSRLVGLDTESLANPATDSIVSQRDSPPPLEDLINTLAGNNEEEETGWNERGWWLGRQGDKEGRVWIGEEEKKTMRLFAGVVCQAIDGGHGGEAGWGEGGLSWEV